MTSSTPTVLGFAAYSGSGKTTLLQHLIPLLKQQGLNVGLIKHSHHDFIIDQPGKDSDKLRKAGATPVLIVSPYRQAIMTDFTSPVEPQLEEQLNYLIPFKPDIVLVEGFRSVAFPKIEIHRPSLGKPLLFPHDSNIIAIACDQDFTLTVENTQFNAEQLKNLSFPKQLDLNNPQQIARFIMNYHFQP
jgi:molybdopterin-guanine dinucleotide biosynthesis protein B